MASFFEAMGAPARSAQTERTIPIFYSRARKNPVMTNTAGCAIRSGGISVVSRGAICFYSIGSFTVTTESSPR